MRKRVPDTPNGGPYSSGQRGRIARVTPGGVALAFVCAAGLAACITLLYQAMAFIMATEGGFVAVGGPYEIAHPAPDWVWIVPVSIMGFVAFVFTSITLDGRGIGASLVFPGWCALFIALGWNFLRLGIFDVPEGMQGGWGWILSGVVFWVMGFGPLVAAVRSLARDGVGALERARTFMVFQHEPPPIAPAYLAVQAVGAATGLIGGILMFARVAGT